MSATLFEMPDLCGGRLVGVYRATLERTIEDVVARLTDALAYAVDIEEVREIIEDLATDGDPARAVNRIFWAISHAGAWERWERTIAEEVHRVAVAWRRLAKAERGAG